MAAYKFMKAIQSEAPITLYNPAVLQRDFTHVSDIVAAILGLLTNIESLNVGQHELFNIGFGSPVLVLMTVLGAISIASSQAVTAVTP